MRILYLDLDTLRPDHLGCYGYRRRTSPNIDAIAGQGLRFDNCHCSDAPCLPSRAALMSGRFGIHTGVVNHGGVCADMRIDGPERGFRDSLSASSLPSMLKHGGLHTCYVGGFGERHSAWWFYAGFREIHDTGMGGMESAEHVTPAAVDWIQRNARRDNWHLQVNYWDPHTPHRAPASFGNPFEGQPLPAWLTAEALERHRQAVGPHTAREINMWDDAPRTEWPRHVAGLADMGDLRRLIDGYDCGIAYMDQHIGTLLAALEEQGVLEDCVIIVSSDHGENFGELGLYAEHGTADQATCRIPLIIRWPDGRRGVDAGLHYNLDLAPTLAELLGAKDRPQWDGASFAPAITRGEACGRQSLVLSQCAHVCQRSVRFGDWLWVRTYHDGFHLFPEQMLYQVSADPNEQHDLAQSRPDLCSRAEALLGQWHSRMALGTKPDPLQAVLDEGGPYHARGMLAKYCERLTQTGRGWAVEELRRRHPREFLRAEPQHRRA